MTSKAADLAKTSTKAGFHYLWGLVISTIISSTGTIFVANLLGSDAYGLYAIVLSVPNLIVIFRDWGINYAIIRYTAQYRAENRNAEIRSIFVAGIVFEFAMSLILSIISLLVASYVANDIFNRPEIVPLIQISSISILASGFFTVSGAIFTGTELTTYNSIMLICQSAIKTFLVVGLVIAGFGTSGAVFGYALSLAVAGIVGILFVFSMYRKLPRPFSHKLEIIEYIKEMLRFSIPLSLSTIITGFLSQFYVILLPIFYSNNSIIGNYNIASSFVVLISFFSLPITNMLLPAFSKLDINKHRSELKNVFQYSVKYSALIVVPVAALVMCLSGPAVFLLFGNEYTSAPFFLALLSISYLLTATGNLSTGNVINSQGQTGLNLKFAVLTSVIGFPLGYVLIMHYGVFGLIFSNLISGIPSMILALMWIKRHYDLSIDWTSSAKIVAASALTAVFTFLLISFTSFSSIVELLMGTVFFLVVLVASLIFTRTLSVNDLNSLRSMTSGLGPISRILNLILNLIDAVMVKLKLN